MYWPARFPGITMLNAIVLVLPFTYLMGIVPSLLLMSGIYCGGVFGGSITGILFNIPGDPMNVPTTWEGYKLNKKGHCAKALGMAIMCSAIGGFVSSLLMIAFSQPFAKFALTFSSAEYFAVVFLGLASVVVIGTRSFGSAMISMCIGLAPRHGRHRRDLLSGPFYLWLVGVWIRESTSWSS